MSAAPEALIICPLCRDGVATSAFDDHLRRAHDLVTYRAVRRSSRETLETVLGDLLTTNPPEDAWQALWQLAREGHGNRADRAVADWLAAALDDLGDGREAVLAALAPLAAPQPRLVAALAAQARTSGRVLA